MTNEDAKQHAKHAAQLFGDLKPEQAKLLIELFESCDPVSVTTALKNHRYNHDFFSFPQFKEALRVEQRKSNERVQARRQEKIVDWIRRTAREQGAVSYDGEEDIHVLLHHFSGAWTQVRDTVKGERGKQTARAYILSHARQAFCQIGMAPDQVEMSARDCVELNSDESIPLGLSRKGLRQIVTNEPALSAPVKPAEALKQLALAEAGAAA